MSQYNVEIARRPRGMIAHQLTLVVSINEPRSGSTTTTSRCCPRLSACRVQWAALSTTLGSTFGRGGIDAGAKVVVVPATDARRTRWTARATERICARPFATADRSTRRLRGPAEALEAVGLRSSLEGSDEGRVVHIGRARWCSSQPDTFRGVKPACPGSSQPSAWRLAARQVLAVPRRSASATAAALAGGAGDHLAAERVGPHDVVAATSSPGSCARAPRCVRGIGAAQPFEEVERSHAQIPVTRRTRRVPAHRPRHVSQRVPRRGCASGSRSVCGTRTRLLSASHTASWLHAPT